MLAAALLEASELCVCDLAWIAERSQTLVSHHVRALRNHGIEGRESWRGEGCCDAC